MSRRARIVVVGSINVDIVVRAERLPVAGETLSGESFALVLGGKGANQAVAAARMGADVTLVAALGEDAFGQFARAELEGYGLTTTHIPALSGVSTGVAAISIDAAGQNAITIVAGANARLTPDALSPFEAAIAAADVLLLQCETPAETNIRAATLARAAGVTVILDPAPVPPAGLAPALWPLVDVLTPNETEAAALIGDAQQTPEKMIDALRKRGARSVVLKRGADGATFGDAQTVLAVPAFNVAVVDTVAAGDTFNAAFGVALAERIGVQGALTLACAAGALACTKAGAAAATPLRATVDGLARTPAAASALPANG